MIGRWVSLVGHDRTRPVMSGGLLEMTGRWGPASGHDQLTCPVTSGTLLETTERWGPTFGHFEQRVRSLLKCTDDH